MKRNIVLSRVVSKTTLYVVGRAKRRCAKRLAEQKCTIIERIRLRDQGGVSEMVGKSLHELSCGLV